MLGNSPRALCFIANDVGSWTHVVRFRIIVLFIIGGYEGYLINKQNQSKNQFSIKLPFYQISFKRRFRAQRLNDSRCFLNPNVVSRSNTLTTFFLAIKINLSKKIKSIQLTKCFLLKELRKSDFLIAPGDT